MFQVEQIRLANNGIHVSGRVLADLMICMPEWTHVDIRNYKLRPSDLSEMAAALEGHIIKVKLNIKYTK